MAEIGDVRVEETLRVRIGEAKNLPTSLFSSSNRCSCCAIKIDSEEIFRTGTVEKSLDPFFGSEFSGEIPKKFRFLSFYLYEVGNKSNKVLGKVSLKKEELYKYHGKEHWFPLTYQDGDSEVQGKVQLEVRMDECLPQASDTALTSFRINVRVRECSDLKVIDASCNPYAVITVTSGKLKETRRTAVKKKTICPQFDETFSFYIDGKGQSHDRSMYTIDDSLSGELSVSLFHDDSKVSREVLGHMFKGSFLGEVKIPLSDINFSKPHKAWYCLQAKEQKASEQPRGSIRLKINYTADYVFPSKYYDGLRQLILESAEFKPVTSSAAFLLGEIVENRQSAAQPLVKLFLHHGKLVPLIHALTEWEMSNTVDPNTLFRGNSLLTRMVDELMKLQGLPYLHDTLRAIIDQICSEGKPCEIDPTRLREGEDLSINLSNLHNYIVQTLNAIVGSGLVCPGVLRDVFSTLKARAMINYPDNQAVRYHAVTSFIFLRFFSAAILGPHLFELRTDKPDTNQQRTLVLVSKVISGLVNLVSSKSMTVLVKEEYMAPLYDLFPPSTQIDIKMFLDIISSSSGLHFKNIEAPILLKEGFMIKRAQGRKRFGLKNFKKRFFRLTNQSLSYSKNKGEKPLFEMPITDIRAVERLEEDSFRMKYMFQVIQTQRALYIQASNCVDEKEWLDILTKICKSNKNRLKSYHPAAFVNNHWLCCKSTDHSLPGCTPVSGGLPLTDIQADVDSDREVEKIHSLFLQEMDKLDAIQECCGSQTVYVGDRTSTHNFGYHIEDPASCFAVIQRIQRCIITLEQEHIQYLRSVHRATVPGSIDMPIGDESGADLVRNLNRSSERLSRHGSRSSNASNISRRSYRGSRSRGGSFRDRERARTGPEGVRKSLSGDVSCTSHNLGVDFVPGEVKKAASYDVMSAAVREDTSEVNGSHNRLPPPSSQRHSGLSGGFDSAQRERSPSHLSGNVIVNGLSPHEAEHGGDSRLIGNRAPVPPLVLKLPTPESPSPSPLLSNLPSSSTPSPSVNVPNPLTTSVSTSTSHTQNHTDQTSVPGPDLLSPTLSSNPQSANPSTTSSQNVQAPCTNSQNDAVQVRDPTTHKFYLGSVDSSDLPSPTSCHNSDLSPSRISSNSQSQTTASKANGFGVSSNRASLNSQVSSTRQSVESSDVARLSNVILEDMSVVSGHGQRGSVDEGSSLDGVEPLIRNSEPLKKQDSSLSREEVSSIKSSHKNNSVEAQNSVPASNNSKDSNLNPSLNCDSIITNSNNIEVLRSSGHGSEGLNHYQPYIPAGVSVKTSEISERKESTRSSAGFDVPDGILSTDKAVSVFSENGVAFTMDGVKTLNQGTNGNHPPSTPSTRTMYSSNVRYSGGKRDNYIEESL